MWRQSKRRWVSYSDSKSNIDSTSCLFFFIGSLKWVTTPLTSWKCNFWYDRVHNHYCHYHTILLLLYYIESVYMFTKMFAPALRLETVPLHIHVKDEKSEKKTCSTDCSLHLRTFRDPVKYDGNNSSLKHEMWVCMTLINSHSLKSKEWKNYHTDTYKYTVFPFVWCHTCKLTPAGSDAGQRTSTCSGFMITGALSVNSGLLENIPQCYVHCSSILPAC